jgi:tetratricopeptide (TPR) repeat protein
MEVLEVLDEAVASGVLASTPHASEDWYRFTHVKIGQVLAQEINSRRRRKLHCQIAGVLEKREERSMGEVAWHFYHAGQKERASRAALDAARHSQALRNWDEALTFSVMAAETGRKPEEIRMAHQLRGDALARLDRPEEAAAAYARARLAGKMEGEEVVDLRRKELRMELLLGTANPAAVAAEVRKLREAAAGHPLKKRCALDVLLAEALLAAGNFQEAIQVAEGAGAAARKENARFEEAEALLVLGAAQLKRKNQAGADRAARDSSQLFLEDGDPHGSALAAMLRATAAAQSGDTPLALELLDGAMKQAERARAPRLVRQIKEKRTEVLK